MTLGWHGYWLSMGCFFFCFFCGGFSPEPTRICLCRCPPQKFVSALSKIFLDPSATVGVLEAAMRAVTFYLDVSADCARFISGVAGAVAAIGKCLESADLTQHESRDLAVQCVKVWPHSCLFWPQTKKILKLTFFFFFFLSLPPKRTNCRSSSLFATKMQQPSSLQVGCNRRWPFWTTGAIARLCSATRWCPP
jgi:hypothetical protein